MSKLSIFLWYPKVFPSVTIQVLKCFLWQKFLQSSNATRIYSNYVNGRIFSIVILEILFYRSTDTEVIFIKMNIGIASYEGDILLVANRSSLFYTKEGGEIFTQVNDIEIINTINFSKVVYEDDSRVLYIINKIGNINGIFCSDDKEENDDSYIYSCVSVFTNGYDIVYESIDRMSSNEKIISVIDDICWSKSLNYSCCTVVIFKALIVLRRNVLVLKIIHIVPTSAYLSILMKMYLNELLGYMSVYLISHNLGRIKIDYIYK
ncbi:hypothetical protein H8356DRAFT_1359486 [Neocallimastix lanati (nom. inval.)]|nr:hypothetical protein H8356DRAFT_1359486 [Neocallimastix sp. JGI-2020a]